MKRSFLIILLCAAGALNAGAQCFTCGELGSAGSDGADIGPSLRLPMGVSHHGLPAGDLSFSSSVPDPGLFTPAVLEYDSSPQVVVVFATNVITATTFVTNSETDVILVATTNVTSVTNYLGVPLLITNYVYVLVTNTTVTTIDVLVTNRSIRQVQAPQMIADIPPPPTANGYVIHLYYASQVTGQ